MSDCTKKWWIFSWTKHCWHTIEWNAKAIKGACKIPQGCFKLKCCRCAKTETHFYGDWD